MEIKCPKCKYRFEEAIPPYETEHSCVCPRCGTPFLYTLPTAEETDGDINATPQQSSGDIPETLSAADDGSDAAKTSVHRSQEASVAQHETPSHGGETHTHHHHSSSFQHRHNNRRRSNKRLFAFFVVIIAVLIGGVLLIGSLFSRHAERFFLAGESSFGAESYNDVDSLDDMFLDDERVPVQTPPQWIQGKWVAHTEYHDIVVYIHNNCITEIDGAYRLNGTFVCRDQKLVCDYGKGGVFVYQLDPSNRTIDCGKGITMQKEQ